MTMGHYLRSMRQLSDQWNSNNFRDERRQRLYLKDIDCPPEWHDYLRKIMPPGLFYWNENVEDHGAKDDDLFMEEKPAAPAGDLMSSLPEEMRAQNLMCYIGHEGTYTPAHREMCASLGQNIMVEASGNENGEKEGSSIWFMTETKDREVVREYFLSMLGHDVEIEKHFAQINAWKKATFPVYIVEQKVGDFILIPPLAPHQVWNRGTRTMKVAWNRTTVETLDYAVHEALPRARLVCRDEQYKNKAMIYFTLKKYYEQLQNAANSQMSWLMGDDVGRDSVRLKQLKRDFKKLLQLFTEILVDEIFSSKEKNMELIPFDSCITCSYCRSNIFNRFLTCKHCVRDLISGDQDTYDVCMECYAMGRSCLCVSGLSWCEQWEWTELVDNYEAWRGMVIYNDGYVDMNLSPPPLEIARMKIDRKSLAQICQEQLRRRPFKDVTKPDKEPDPEPDEPVIVDEQGNPKKPKRKKKKGDTYKCHTCCHKDYTYRLAFCTNPGCNLAYCFGVLYRAFDMMPQEVLQVERWQCPKCQGICNCGSCRRTGNTNPYEPKNTYIGHDTRAVADDRSQETLVDFRVHNLNWLKAAGDESRNNNSKRIQRLRQQADAEKEKDQDFIGSLANNGAPQQNGPAEHAQAPEVYDGVVEQQNGATPAVEQPPPNENGELADLAALPDPNATLYPETAYPDPLGGAERRLGMGYYEQDDSPDKILFNPYEEPTGEDIFDEESEYVKKSLRAAKRRARQHDDDDPDFTVGRSHKKKKVDKTPRQSDGLQNMDPALLGGEDITMVDAPAETQSVTPAEEDHGGQNGAVGESVSDHGRPFDPNIPTLRHARPKISYADAEDIEEFNETIPTNRKKATPASRPASAAPVPDASTDPLDLAAEAMRIITSTNAQTPQPVPRKRGRPRKSDVAVHSSPNGASKPLMPQPTSSGKRRGRPPKSSLAISSAASERDESQSPHHDATIDELEQELSQELETDGDYVQPATAQPAPAPRRRGRPPKNAAQKTGRSTPSRVSGGDGPPAAPPAPDEKFLSMSERMALRGKKVKIGKRKKMEVAKQPPEDSAGPAVVEDADEGMPAEEEPQEPEAPREPEEPEQLEEFEQPDEPEQLDETRQSEGDDDGYAPMDDHEEDDGYAPMNDYEAEDDIDEEPITSRPASIAPIRKAPSVAPSRSRVSSAARAILRESSYVPPDKADAPRDPSPAPLPPKPTGPTVVRLGESDEEDSYSFYGESLSESGSGSDVGSAVGDEDEDADEDADKDPDEDVGDDEDEDEDEDIPAAPVVKPALRGRMATRGGGGRGRGRGRPRGRGRGRGRA